MRKNEGDHRLFWSPYSPISPGRTQFHVRFIVWAGNNWSPRGAYMYGAATGSYGTKPCPYGSVWTRPSCDQCDPIYGWETSDDMWALQTKLSQQVSASLWPENNLNMFDPWRVSPQIILWVPMELSPKRAVTVMMTRAFWVPTNVWGKYKDLWRGQFLISRSFRWKSPAVISFWRAKQMWGKKMLVPIEEIRSLFVRHLQSQGGHGPNMGPTIFMAVWTSGMQQCNNTT